MKKFIFIIVIVSICAVSSMKSDSTQTKKKKFTKFARTFGGNIFATVSDCQSDESNIIYSPLSLYLTLGMLRLGAGGNTRDEISSIMNLEPENIDGMDIDNLMRKTFNNAVLRKSEVILRVANALFVKRNYSVIQKYKEDLEEIYFGHIEEVDFNLGGINRINEWIANATENKITDVISPQDIEPLTRLILTNAIYFNASWKSDFLKTNEQENISFILRDGSVAQANFIEQENRMRYLLEKGMVFVAIPYASNSDESYDSTDYLIVGMPDLSQLNGDMESYNAKLDSFILNAGNRMKFWNLENWSTANVRVIIPEFKIEQELDVKCVLQRHFVDDLFNASASNFSGISTEQIFVSEFRHKAIIDVNQLGTEAAAVSVVTFLGRSIARTEFVANRPFIYAIYNQQSQMTVFLGKVEVPTSP